MAGGKETPRQKMIGLMYLVLTAMLALNVSKSILNGYLSVNDSLEKSKKNMAANNDRVTEAFKATINGNKAAEPYFKEIQVSQKDIKELFQYIDLVKANMVHYVLGLEESQKLTVDSINLRKEPFFANIGDYDKPMTVMLGTGDHPAKGPLTADELRQKMEELHKKLVGQLEKMQKTDGLHLLKEDYDNLKKKIDILKPEPSGFEEDGIKFTWEMDNVEHLPMAAVYVNMNKLQADLKNVEADMLQVFSGASGKLAIKFDNIYAKVIAPSSYIQAGQPYKAEIFLAATNSKLGAGDMEVLLGVDSLTLAKNGKGGTPVPIVGGMGMYQVGTGATGDQKYSGVIKYKKPDGSFEYYPFSGEYKVAKSAVSVSAEQMNVFYRGVVNPVAAGAAGISPTDIQISASGAGVKYVPRGEPGKYDFTFTGVGECLITVSAKTKDGVKPQGPPIKFRVKPLPKPEAKVGGKFAPPEMKKGDLSTVGAIGAGANGFDFQANYIVQSYDLVGKVKGKLMTAQGNGANLAPDAISIFKGADVNTKIYIDIKVKGPDGIIYSSTCGIKVLK